MPGAWLYAVSNLTIKIVHVLYLSALSTLDLLQSSNTSQRFLWRPGAAISTCRGFTFYWKVRNHDNTKSRNYDLPYSELIQLATEAVLEYCHSLEYWTPCLKPIHHTIPDHVVPTAGKPVFMQPSNIGAAAYFNRAKCVVVPREALQNGKENSWHYTRFNWNHGTTTSK